MYSLPDRPMELQAVYKWKGFVNKLEDTLFSIRRHFSFNLYSQFLEHLDHARLCFLQRWQMDAIVLFFHLKHIKHKIEMF